LPCDGVSIVGNVRRAPRNGGCRVWLWKRHGVSWSATRHGARRTAERRHATAPDELRIGLLKIAQNRCDDISNPAQVCDSDMFVEGVRPDHTKT
jgi:hypothetical protein